MASKKLSKVYSTFKNVIISRPRTECYVSKDFKNFPENITKTAIMEHEKITMKIINRQFKNYLYSRGTAKGLLRFKPRGVNEFKR